MGVVSAGLQANALFLPGCQPCIHSGSSASGGSDRHGFNDENAGQAPVGRATPPVLCRVSEAAHMIWWWRQGQFANTLAKASGREITLPRMASSREGGPVTAKESAEAARHAREAVIASLRDSSGHSDLDALIESVRKRNPDVTPSRVRAAVMSLVAHGNAKVTTKGDTELIPA